MGFLWWNCYPARVFMGDVGSLSLGGALGTVAILIKQELLLFSVGGLFVVEALSVTRIEAGIADNVIPDRAEATLNLRYPPDRTTAEAEAYLASLVPDRATLEISSHAPPGRVVIGSPLVEGLRVAGAAEVEPKQAWTNVADFTAHGIDAVNFGPGHTAYAHRRDERVEIAALVHSYETLHRFLTTPIRDDPSGWIS